VASDQAYAPATASEAEAMNRRSMVRVIRKCLQTGMFWPFRERLKGFEPSTFCMASNGLRPDGTKNCLQTRGFSLDRGSTAVPGIHADCRGFGYPMGTNAPRLWTAGLLGRDVLVWPPAGADAFVKGVRCKVRTARPDDRAGLGVDLALGEALRGSRLVENRSTHPGRNRRMSAGNYASARSSASRTVPVSSSSL